MRYLFKCIGISGIVLCLSVSGFLKTRRKREYIRWLKAVGAALDSADDMLTLYNTDRERILAGCFGKVKGISLAPFAAVCEKTAGKLAGTLSTFFAEFGSGDIQLEHSRISRVKREVSLAAAKEEREYAQYGKIWQTAGVCAGLAAGILLI